jgi:hypothetical protein
MEGLPSSLKHLKTNFSISTTSNNWQEFQLSNLCNLETLDLSSKPWFIFNGISRNKLSISDIKSLETILPKLKGIQLRISQCTAAEVKTGVIDQYVTVTHGLVQKFQKDLVVKKGEGVLLKISTSR